MYIISSRKHFSNPDALSENGHHVKEINLLDDSELDDFSDRWPEFIDRVKNKRILLLVHGYNTEHDEVNDAYSVIEQKIGHHLADEYDLVIGYSWPGGDLGFEWWSSKRRANAVARRFRFLLEELAEKTRFIDIMSHSLGARVVLKALKQSASNRAIIRHYFCTAAAVDNEVLEAGEEFHNAIDKMASLFVFHSWRDGVLSLAYRSAEFDNALGLYGPEDKAYIQSKTRNIYVANCKKIIDSHGGYKRSDPMYAYIARSIVKKPVKFKTL